MPPSGFENMTEKSDFSQFGAAGLQACCTILWTDFDLDVFTAVSILAGLIYLGCVVAFFGPPEAL